MKILIVEDEQLARERLSMLIQKYDSDIKIVAFFDSIQDTINFFRKNGHVDLAFFDIQLSDGSGF